MFSTAIMHGIGGWFDINFLGSQENVVLSTAPECPGTHWYQCRLLFSEPIAVNKGQTVIGELHFTANASYSYFIDIVASIDGTSVITQNRVNLKDQVSLLRIFCVFSLITIFSHSTTHI